MDFLQVVNFLAAVVTIVGGGISIVRAVRPARAAASAPAPSQTARAPIAPAPRSPASGEVAPTLAPRASSGSSGAAAVGVRYGLVLMGLMIVIALVGPALSPGAFGSDATPTENLIASLTILAWVVLFVVAGLLPARRSGSIWAGLIAAVFVAIGLAAAGGLYDAVHQPYRTVTDIWFGFVLGLIGIVIFSVIPAVIGRVVYRRNSAAFAPVSHRIG